MEESEQSRNASSYTTRLDRTLKALQDRVKEQEAVLLRLRASTTALPNEPSRDPKIHLRQTQALRLAYESVVPAEPWLPPQDSPLPALLALRNTDTCIQETQTAIATTTQDLKAKTQRLEKEEADSNDSKLIQTALQNRIGSLQDTIEQQTQKTPDQIGRDLIQEVKSKTAYYDGETERLVTAYNGFIDEHLAVLLAAEELGGPIVGDQLDIDEDILEAGFSNKGKAKATKKNVNQDKRQRRLDDIWGARDSDDDDADEPWTEKRAAAAEMRELTELLLNGLVEAGGNGPGAYVDLERDSAAARFLVRSKVAQFHPRDARKLRMLDFGGEFDE